jgi:hypothetical protein
MAAVMSAAPACFRASASPATTRRARAPSSRVVAPAALRRSTATTGRRASSLVVSTETRDTQPIAEPPVALPRVQRGGACRGGKPLLPGPLPTVHFEPQKW